MSKLSFRARALDPSKPMPIYMAEELPDLPDFSAINRAVPQMPTGMQKEEECEHHLQRAICAGLIIPTPEVTDVPLVDFYDRVYPASYKQPRQLIHMQPFTMEQEIPDYDMDSEDELWLQTHQPKLDLTPLKFEEMMDRLEKSSEQTVVTLVEAKYLLKEDDELTIAVFDYWLNKRLKTQHPLILSVRTEHRTGQAANNPYLAFRRRTEKMQTRKNRKNDEVSYEKMLKLRRDLARAVTLLELVKRREKCKREFVHLTVEVFEKRFHAGDYSGTVVAEAQAIKVVPSRPAFTPIFHNHHHHNQSWHDSTGHSVTSIHHKSSIRDDMLSRREKRQYKKRKHKSLSRGGGSQLTLSSDEESPSHVIGRCPPSPDGADESQQSADDDGGQFAFRRNRLCSYHKPLPAPGGGNWSWCSSAENGGADKRFRFTLTSLSDGKCIGFARRRLGRGGRVILDRAGTDYDDFWRGLDFSIIEPKPDPLQQRLKDDGIVMRKTITSHSNNGGVGDKNNLLLSGSSDIISRYKNDRCSDYLSNCAVDNSEIIKTEVKVEPALDVALHQPEEEEEEDVSEFLKTVSREWLHFRPKTPSPDSQQQRHEDDDDSTSMYATASTASFRMEVEPLEGTNFLLTDDDTPPFITDLFQLQPPMGANKLLGPHDPIFEEPDDDDVNEVYWRTIGVSSFTLKDAGGVAAASSYSSLAKNHIDDDEDDVDDAYESNATNGLIGISRSALNLLTTSAQSVTLNSHSANNLLEFDEAGGGGGGANKSTPPTPNGGVRNNKGAGVPMEVT